MNETIKLIKKEKKQEISPAKIINAEVNLLVFPFFALDKKEQKKRIEVEYKSIVKRGDEKIEILWRVSSSGKYGYPGPFDREVHKVIEQIISEVIEKKGRVENPIPFSIYNLCERMNISKFGGKNYRMVKKALKRIKMTGIESEGAFYHKGRKQWISKIFGLYDSIVLKGEELEDGRIAETNLLYLNDLYLQSLNSFYIKPIDYQYLQSLKSKIASRLYEILGVKFYGLRNKKEKFICYKYSNLCQLLPVIPQKYISWAKRQLDPAHKELKNTEFLLKYTWDNDSGKDWLIYYWPGKRAKKETREIKTEFFESQPIEEFLPKPKEKPKTLTNSQIDLVNQLVALNVSKITAKDLVRHTSEQVIKTWIEVLGYVNPKNKAGYLVKAIKENWQVPEEYLRGEEEKREREKIEKMKLAKESKEKEEQSAKQKEAKKLDKVYSLLSPSQKKKVKEEATRKLAPFWQEKVGKEGERLSKLTKVALDEKIREVVKDWITEGKINGSSLVKAKNGKV